MGLPGRGETGVETWEPGWLGSLASLGQVAPSKDRIEPILLGRYDDMVPSSQHLEVEAGGYL